MSGSADSQHASTQEAWSAVGKILKENWQQDKAKIPPHVRRQYARGAMICLRGDLADASFEVAGLRYAVIACSETHALRPVS